MQPIPVVTIAGYLGAGKTSLINHILGMPHVSNRQIALIINEFGDTNIDGKLVPDEQQARYELNKGSVFCTCVKTEFLNTLQNIADSVQPDLVLVEATGIADPCDLVEILDAPHLKNKFSTRANICVVDASNFTKVAPYMKTAQNQVRWADGIVLNKTDLVPPKGTDKVAQTLRKLNPSAPQTRAVKGGITEQFLQDLQHTPVDLNPSQSPPNNIIATTVSMGHPVARETFLNTLNELGEHLLRSKGIVNFGDGAVLVQSVFQDTSETEPPQNTPEDDSFVIITQGLDRDEVTNRFERIQPPE